MERKTYPPNVKRAALPTLKAMHAKPITIPTNLKVGDLTPRMHDVARGIANGYENDEIATILKISVETVKEHVQSILRRSGLRNRTEVAVWYVLDK